jgi:hypothetical protein
MALSVQCDACGARYNVGENLAGKRAKCKKCGATMQIPALAADAGAEDESLAALMDLARESGEGTPPARGRTGGAARPSAATPPAGWTPESVIVETAPNPSPTSAFGSGRWQRNSGGIGRLVKPLIILCIIGGLGYGGWYLFNSGKAGDLVASAKVKLGGKKEKKKDPADNQPKLSEAEQKRNTSAERLGRIHATLTAYTGKNAGNWPADLKTLQQDQSLDAEALSSPFGPAFASPDIVYKPYVAEAVPAADAVIAHDAAELASGEGATLLFGDGLVKWLGKDAAQAAIQRSDEVRTAAAKEREQKVALARQQEGERVARERQMREQGLRAQADQDPNFRPPARQDLVQRIQGGAEGLAQGVQDVAMRRNTEMMIRPVYPGSVYGVIVRDVRGDTVEVYNGKGAEPVAVAQFPTDQQFQAASGAYALSADGKYIARVVSFPRLKAAVWSVEKNADVQSYDLNDDFGQPSLVGFLMSDRLAVRWEKGSQHGIEVYNLKVGQRGRQIELAGIIPGPGSEAVSPDGRLYAAVARFKGAMQLQVYDTVTGGQPRRFLAPGLNNQLNLTPAGVAFSPDRARVAALFEQGGRAVVVVWQMVNGKISGEHVVPGQIEPPTDGRARRLRSLDWVGGKALLVCGTVVMNADTGALVTTLDAGKVKGQAVTGNATVHLAHGSEQNIEGVTAVTLDETKFPATGGGGALNAAPRTAPRPTSPGTLGTPRAGAGTQVVPGARR